MTQTYGFEIECFGLTPAELQIAINSVDGAEVAVPVARATYHFGPSAPTMTRIFSYGESKSVGLRCSREQGTAVWMVAEDCSIRNTAGRGIAHEVISPILYGQQGIDNMKAIVKALSRAGAEVNSSCGVHVHLGTAHNSRVRRMSAAKKNRMIHRIGDLYSHFKGGIDLLVPRSRRAGQNSYCGNVRNNQNCDNVHDDYCNIAFSFRRGVVNVQNYRNNGTIEFRQHSGSLNGVKLANWARLMSKIVGWAINDNHPYYQTPFSSVCPHNAPYSALPEQMNQLTALCTFLNIETAHRRALLRRANELNGGDIFAEVA
jgi:hypothetical protein